METNVTANTQSIRSNTNIFHTLFAAFGSTYALQNKTVTVNFQKLVYGKQKEIHIKKKKPLSFSI